MQEEKLVLFAIQNSCGPSTSNQSWSGMQKKVIHILQFKYLIMFAQAELKPSSSQTQR